MTDMEVCGYVRGETFSNAISIAARFERKVELDPGIESSYKRGTIYVTIEDGKVRSASCKWG